jgi:ribonuclease D
VHEVCAGIDLFHCTVDLLPEEDGGGGGGGRAVFVSPYADGFDALLSLREQQQQQREIGTGGRRCSSGEQRIMPAYRYPPRLSTGRRPRQKGERQRQESAPAGAGDDGDESDGDENSDTDRTYLVESLIDQPGDCLRPGVDSLDFGALEAATLDSLVGGPPRSAGDSFPWELVDTPSALESCARDLQTCTEIGFDLEAFNRSKSAQITCLLQIRAGDTGKEYVIDPLAPGMWARMPVLRSVFENPGVVKVGHSIGSLDVRCLHRDFGIWVVNAFDTHEAARALGLDRRMAGNGSGSGNGDGNGDDGNGNGNGPVGLGLTALCRHYGCAGVSGHERLKAEYQRCDWRARPLSPQMLEYGRLDVRYLVSLRLLMVRDLTRSELYDRRLDELRRESRLVAEALEAVARMEEEYELAAGGGSERDQDRGGGASSWDARPAAAAAGLDDDGTFRTSRQREAPSARSTGGGAGYFTAASSLGLDSGEEEEEGDGEDESEGGVVLDRRREGGVVLSPAVVAPAETLRMHPLLMRVITCSQERCLSLWSPPKQRDALLEKSLLDLWFYQQRVRAEWDDSNARLYLELAEWRAGVAAELGCSEEFVADLDFLVLVAWRKPGSLWALRRVSWELPDVLADFDRHRDALLAIVRKYRPRGGGDGVRFYRAEETWYRRKKALMATTAVACAAVLAAATISRVLKRRR